MPVFSHSDVFVLDNGAYSMKAGFSNQSECRVLPNCITKAKSEKRRAFIADQVRDCRDLSSLYYLLPFQRGYLVNWHHQKTIWDYLFGKSCFNFDPSDVKLIITQPHFNVLSIQEGLAELLFEEYQFKSIFFTRSTDLSCYKNKLDHSDEEAVLVVDTGYSFSHVVPIVGGHTIKEAVIRVDVGGKLLTNHLKEIISYRQLHVLEETYVMNACKEDACFVSLDFNQDLCIAAKEARIKSRRPSDCQDDAPLITRDYVLPDFTTLRRGYLRSASASLKPVDGEQTIRLCNERFMVPELLFNPSDVGVDQCGLPEAIVLAISRCEEHIRPWLFRNILLTGGNVCFPHFATRMEQEVRQLAPDTYTVVVRTPDDCVSYAWCGGAALAKDPSFDQMCVSRQDYAEKGAYYCIDKFDI